MINIIIIKHFNARLCPVYYTATEAQRHGWLASLYNRLFKKIFLSVLKVAHVDYLVKGRQPY